MFKFNIFGNGQLLALKYPIDIAATLSFVVSSGTRLFFPAKRRRGKTELAVLYKFIRHQPLWPSHRSPSLPSPSKESPSFVGASCVSGANSVGQLLSLSLSSSFTISLIYRSILSQICHMSDAPAASEVAASVGNWMNSPHRWLTGELLNSFTGNSPVFHRLFHQLC